MIILVLLVLYIYTRITKNKKEGLFL